MAATDLKIFSTVCISCREVSSLPSTSSLFSKSTGLRLCLSSRKLSRSQTLKPALTRFSTVSIVSEQKPSYDTVTPGDVTDKTWKSLVLDSDIPVVVDFWAPWCGPCRMILPLIDELSKEYAGKVRFLKLNTDECPNTATEYGIRSIPTIMIFIGGQRRDTVIGAVSKTSLVSTIENFFE